MSEDNQTCNHPLNNQLIKPVQWDLTEHFKKKSEIIHIKQQLDNQYVKVHYSTCSVSDYIHQQEAKHLKRLERLQKVKNIQQLYKIRKVLESIHPGGEQFYISIDTDKIVVKPQQYWNFYLQTLNRPVFNQTIVNKNTKQQTSRKLHQQIRQLQAHMCMCNIRIKNYQNKLKKLSNQKLSKTSHSTKSDIIRSICHERKSIIQQYQLLQQQLSTNQSAEMNIATQSNVEHQQAV